MKNNKLILNGDIISCSVFCNTEFAVMLKYNEYRGYVFLPYKEISTNSTTKSAILPLIILWGIFLSELVWFGRRNQWAL